MRRKDASSDHLHKPSRISALGRSAHEPCVINLGRNTAVKAREIAADGQSWRHVGFRCETSPNKPRAKACFKLKRRCDVQRGCQRQENLGS